MEAEVAPTIFTEPPSMETDPVVAPEPADTETEPPCSSAPPLEPAATETAPADPSLEFPVLHKENSQDL